MKYIFPILLCFACASSEQTERLRTRNVIAYVCHNPESIWHLSECNDECTRVDYNDNAYCLGLTDVMCEENKNTNKFIRRACGLYHR